MGDVDEDGGCGGGGYVLEADGVGEDGICGEPAICSCSAGTDYVVGVEGEDGLGAAISFLSSFCSGSKVCNASRSSYGYSSFNSLFDPSFNSLLNYGFDSLFSCKSSSYHSSYGHFIPR